MPDEGIVVLGIPIPSSSPLFLSIVAVHVAAGLVCTIAGIGAMLTPKRAVGLKAGEQLAQLTLAKRYGPRVTYLINARFSHMIGTCSRPTRSSGSAAHARCSAKFTTRPSRSTPWRARRRCPRFHFIRQFNALFGETPHQYRIEARLDRAKQLLARGEHSVTDVCMEVGFSSLGSFSDLFARRVGMSPSAYRRRARAMVVVPGDLPSELFPGCLNLMAAAFATFEKPPRGESGIVDP